MKLNTENNYLIMGQNEPVLNAMMPFYENKISTIYIDPPYNSQIDYLNYKDSFYNKNGFNEWVNFIKPLILLSKRMLTNSGVMFIHLDESELISTTTLCYEIFGKKNTNIIIWPKTNVDYDQNRISKSFINIKSVHEYIIVCYRDIEKTKFNKMAVPLWEDHKYVKDQMEWCESIIKNTGTTSSAKDEIQEIFGDRKYFSTPKPVKLIEELIRISTPKDGIFLDYFAGSGTSAEAIIKLNVTDGIDRKFVLVTNNENNICKAVTKKRIDKAKENYKWDNSYCFVDFEQDI